MTAKEKTTKKPKRTARKKATPTKVGKRPKKLAKKQSAPKRAKNKKVAVAKQPRKMERVGEVAFPPERRARRSGEQSEDLQGLSRIVTADSESVDELIEEGNAFEADVVAG